MEKIQIKGTSLKYLIDFISSTFHNQYDKWFAELPDQSKAIFKDLIFSTRWYDLNFGHVEAIKTIGKVFYGGDYNKAAYELGKFGGRKALSGIYKIFIRIPSLDFVIKKVSSITSTYYSKQIHFEITEHNDKVLSLSVTGFQEGQELMLANISGWLDNLMAMISKQNYEIKFSSESSGNGYINGFIDIFFL